MKAMLPLLVAIGRYFQITRDTSIDGIAPLWVGWHSDRRRQRPVPIA
jgi:hypothetical protein